MEQIANLPQESLRLDLLYIGGFFSSSFFDPTRITLLRIALNRLSINNWHEAFVAVHTFSCVSFAFGLSEMI